MKGYDDAVVLSLEQTESMHDETARLDLPQGYLVQDIARKWPSGERFRAASTMATTTVSTRRDASQPSQGIIDFEDMFPPAIHAWPDTRYKFSVLQEWEGYVVSISKDTFTARLADISRGSGAEEEEADFPLDDLEDIDRSKIRNGAIFRWIIGYHRGTGGTKDRFSRIVFRNLPAWTAKELERNRREATEWAKSLKEE